MRKPGADLVIGESFPAEKCAEPAKKTRLDYFTGPGSGEIKQKTTENATKNPFEPRL